VNVLSGHDAGGDRMLQIAHLERLREHIGHDARPMQERRRQFLLASAVCTDSGDEATRGDIVDVKQRGA
jgi:hypothetical protein